MQFALIGEHADGLDMARALTESGRHQLIEYCGPVTGAEQLRRWNLEPRRVGDLESVLANPAVSAVIVAGQFRSRADQLRRVVQSERHLLCVHPADPSPDIAYEANMMQGDTKQLLFPVVPEALHPAFARFHELLAFQHKSNGEAGCRLFEMERWFAEEISLEEDSLDLHVALPGWFAMRWLGGDIAEISALAPGDVLQPDRVLVVSGQFTGGGMIQASYIPRRPHERWRIRMLLQSVRIELLFADGWPGPACLTWTDELGDTHEETWQTWNPWPAVVTAFEASLATHVRKVQAESQFQTLPDKSEHIKILNNAGNAHPPNAAAKHAPGYVPTWNDETRALELDDAVQRSVHKRRTSILDFQEVTEEATFKGTMTLVGCSIIWISLLLLILSVWLPWLGWFIVPVFAGFLVLQLVLRWVVRTTPADNDSPSASLPKAP